MSLVECVPNFSEGRDRGVLDAIASAVRGVDGVELLDVDPGAATNRTVFTFVGPPQAVAEAAFRAVAVAAERIDMRRQRGEHPRMGAADVVPFVPLQGATMADCVDLARQVGRRIGDELRIPVYLYEHAATRAERRSLSAIRAGEYEALPQKLADPAWAPDFGPAAMNERSGATVVGAREFLIAYNVNLNTRDRKLAQEIALTVRESGRARRDAQGEIVRNGDGTAVMVPGTLAAAKAVGWVIDEYRRAQVSINLLDYKETPIHAAFDECCRVADALGVRVTGSEIVGLVPLEALLMAGRHYLWRQRRSTGVPEAELVACAVQSLGLSELQPFDPQQKVIEYRMVKPGTTLRGMTLSAFADELSTDSPAPGGGSVAALCGGLAAALAAMVANLTHGRKGREAAWEEMGRVADEAQGLKDAFLLDVDRDTQAFGAVMSALRLPKASPEEKAARARALDQANRGATLVPLDVLRRTLDVLRLLEAVVARGNPSSLSDAGVGGLVARACAEGAIYNVRTNLKSMSSSAGPETLRFVDETLREAEALRSDAARLADALAERVRAALG
jgi:glutamate formiminotransferase/formiminotetrahydrofolate cyclodeaminase